MLRGRCHWSWTYVFLTTVGEVDLTPGPQCNPTDIDRPLNETTEEILQYRTDYNNRPSHAISFMSPIPSTSESTWWICVTSIFAGSPANCFLPVSGVQLPQTNFHFRCAAFSSPSKTKVDNILTKDVTLRIVLSIDGTPIVSRSHTHPSHTQNSSLFTLSLSLGVPVPHTTQCMQAT